MENDKSEEVEEIIIDVAKILRDAGRIPGEIESKKCDNSISKDSLNCGIGRELFTKDIKETENTEHKDDKEHKEDKEE